MKVHGTHMRCAGRSQTTRLYDGSRRDPGGPKQGSTDLARRGIERSKLGGWSRIPKDYFYQQSINNTRKRTISSITQEVCGCIHMDIQ